MSDEHDTWLEGIGVDVSGHTQSNSDGDASAGATAPAPSDPSETSAAPGTPSADAPADAPTDPTPTDAAPTDAAPTDAAPTDAAPIDAAPTDAAPTDAAPTDAAPTDAAPTDAAPTDAAPTDAAPTEDPVCAPVNSQLAAPIAATASTPGAAADNSAAGTPTGSPPPDSPDRADQDKKAGDSLSSKEKTEDDRKKETDDAYAKAAGKAAETALDMFLKSPEGKALEAAAGKELDKIPLPVKIVVPIAALGAAAAGLAATKGEFPIDSSPKIPLGKIGELKVSAKVTFKGPVNKPTEFGVTITFESESKPAPPSSPPSSDSGGGDPSQTPILHPVLIASFDWGKMATNQLIKLITDKTEPKPGAGTIIVTYFYTPTENGPDAPDDIGLAKERAGAWQSSIQGGLSNKYRVVAKIGFKHSEARLLPGLGGNDVGVVFVPPGG